MEKSPKNTPNGKRLKAFSLRSGIRQGWSLSLRIQHSAGVLGKGREGERRKEGRKEGNKEKKKERKS